MILLGALELAHGLLVWALCLVGWYLIYLIGLLV